MIPEFYNKPGVVLSGKSWGVQHLDRFLASEWGVRLFKPNKKPNITVNADETFGFYPSSPIRPSASFLAQPREKTPAVILRTNSSVTKYPHYIDNKSFEAQQSINQVQQKLLCHTNNSVKYLPAHKRKQAFDAEMMMKKEYFRLKRAQGLKTKQERIRCNEYRNGVVVDGVVNSLFNKNALERSVINEHQNKLNRRAEERMNNLRLHTASSSNIIFFNQRGEGLCESAHKHRASPIKADDAVAGIFKAQPVINPTPSRVLKTSHSRDFNIISGAIHTNPSI